MSFVQSLGEFAYDAPSVADGSPVVVGIPPVKNAKIKVRRLLYTAGTATKAITFLSPLARTTVAVQALAGATALVLTRDPGNYSAAAAADRRPTPSVANNPIAAGDYFCVQLPDGTFLFGSTSAVATDPATGRVTLTVAALPAGGVDPGAEFWFFGVAADLPPSTGRRHVTISAASGATLDRSGAFAGPLAVCQVVGAPMLMLTDATGQSGSLLSLAGDYGN